VLFYGFFEEKTAKKYLSLFVGVPKSSLNGNKRSIYTHTYIADWKIAAHNSRHKRTTGL
jgi:hypothetical protein